MSRQIVSEGQYLAVFNSTHRVMKAEALLKTNRLDILLIPAPRAIQTDCGLAIRFDENELGVVMKALDENSLLPAFLCRMHDGNYITVEEYADENH